MKIDIIYDDDNLIFLDKPAGILIHPTLTKEDDTLVSFLVKKYPGIDKLDWPDKNRIGVVHRLDKDTSGVIVMAKTPEVLSILQKQFKEHQIQKTYLALVLGKVEKAGKVEAAIERGEAGTQKVVDFNYSFNPKIVRPAVTFYKPIKYYRFNNNDLTLLEVKPKTGRMHQIRVHLKYLGFPIIGDQLYNIKPSRQISKKLNFNRQFLHASKIEFTHPVSNQKMIFESKLADDLQNILDQLK